MKTPPRLIGLTGTNGAGKGEAAAYFVAKGTPISPSPTSSGTSSGSGARPPSRDNLIRTGNELRERFGPDVLARRTIEKIGDGGRAVIDSIRNIRARSNTCAGRRASCCWPSTRRSR